MRRSAVLAALILVSAAFADDAVPVVTPAEAVKKVDQQVTV
jgi:hypothetical protein